MGFWSFIRDMFVFDWLFGHRKKESFWEQRQKESQRYDNHSSHDECGAAVTVITTTMVPFSKISTMTLIQVCSMMISK